ncbi:hypothetical protein [Georgenia alba]|uniref:DUF4386 family protein n=1 Tax=Georgenia alba TaxID=2233858 RepID=A0ABW2Q830_9MICO
MSYGPGPAQSPAPGESDARLTHPAQPSPWGSGGTRETAERWAVAAVLVLAASEYVTVGRQLAFSGTDLDLGFTQNNVVWIIAANAMWATALLAAAAAATRAARVVVLAGVVAGLHLLALLGILVVQAVLGAERHLMAQTVDGLVLVVAALVAVLLGGLGRSRDRTGRRSTSFALGGVLLPLGAMVVLDVLRMVELATESDFLTSFVLSELYGAAAFLGVLLTGLRSRATRWAGVAVFVLGAVYTAYYLVQAVLGGYPGAEVDLVANVLYLVGWLAALVLGILAARSTRSTRSSGRL